jgi:uncharacterized protein YukJ
MPLKRYGLLKAQAVDRRLATGNSPHYHIRVTDGEASHRVAVNTRSQLPPSEVLYLVDEHFSHPITAELAEVDFGFTPLASGAGGLALDYIRGNLFDRSEMKPLPLSASGPDNDLNDKLDRQVQQALAEEDAEVYAFGEPWGPESKTDRLFGFRPGHGIHDIHMNQGNAKQFVDQDGVWQDGALLMRFPSQDRWTAVFLAFQSQAFHTDDTTGHRIETPAEKDEVPVAIIAALVNADRESAEEMVTLINRSDREIVLDGWSLADKKKRKKRLAGIRLAPHGTAAVRIRDQSKMQLANDGGIITLLDPDGIKIHGVSYTRTEASREGWLILF